MDNISRDALSVILRFCYPPDFLSLMLTCKQFRDFMQRESFWWDLLKRLWPNYKYLKEVPPKPKQPDLHERMRVVRERAGWSYHPLRFVESYDPATRQESMVADDGPESEKIDVPVVEQEISDPKAEVKRLWEVSKYQVLYLATDPFEVELVKEMKPIIYKDAVYFVMWMRAAHPTRKVPGGFSYKHGRSDREMAIQMFQTSRKARRSLTNYLLGGAITAYGGNVYAHSVKLEKDLGLMRTDVGWSHDGNSYPPKCLEMTLRAGSFVKLLVFLSGKWDTCQYELGDHLWYGTFLEPKVEHVCNCEFCPKKIARTF